MKRNRITQSTAQKIDALFNIAFVYIFSIIIGIVLAVMLKDLLSPIVNLFVADIATTIVIYIFNLIYKNASVYDPYWSVIPPCLVLGWYLLYGLAFNPLHLIVLLPLLFWAVRLTANWAYGFKDFKWQDWRYTELKTKTKKWFPLVNFIGIMLMPSCLTYAGSIPLYFMLTATATNIIPLIIGGIMMTFAATYQTIADVQIKCFLKARTDNQECINSGLWKYSRHPNYFGEVTLWWGVFVASLSNFNWLSIMGCVLITLLFIFISVPLMENHMTSKTSQYTNYKKSVRTMLIPFPYQIKTK